MHNVGTVTPAMHLLLQVVGVVTAVGAEVIKYKVGDHVGVGCMVNSCRSCEACEAHCEQFCGQCAFTYNGCVDALCTSAPLQAA